MFYLEYIVLEHLSKFSTICYWTYYRLIITILLYNKNIGRYQKGMMNVWIEELELWNAKSMEVEVP